MRLPNAERAIIAESKVRGYLLSSRHAPGKHKATYFIRMGFQTRKWREMEAALRRDHLPLDAEALKPTKFGRKFKIVGELRSPDGRTAIIRSIWIILHGEDLPRLVTAYPEEWRK